MPFRIPDPNKWTALFGVIVPLVVLLDWIRGGQYGGEFLGITLGLNPLVGNTVAILSFVMLIFSLGRFAIYFWMKARHSSGKVK